MVWVKGVGSSRVGVGGGQGVGVVGSRDRGGGSQEGMGVVG